MAQLHRSFLSAPATIELARGLSGREGLLDDVCRLSLELVGDDHPLSLMCREHLSTGGGKLRARLALTAAAALGVDGDAAIGWAAACEMMHNATLIHDDLQDRDPERRGRPTVWKRHGEAQAINAGDLLLTLPYRAVEHVTAEPGLRWSLTRAIAARAEETVRGQSLEMTLLERRPWLRYDYERAARGKTGALIGLSVEGIALVSGQSPEQARAIGDAFRDIGLVYQLQDDVIDLFGNKRKGRPGTDIFEGKVTALVIEHVRLHPEEHERLHEILSRPARLTTPSDVEWTVSRFDTGGAVSAVLARALDVSAEILARPIFHRYPELPPLAHHLMAQCLKPLEDLLSSRRLSGVNANAC